MPTNAYLDSKKREPQKTPKPFLQRVPPIFFFLGAVALGLIFLLFHAYCEAPSTSKMLLTFLKEAGFALVVAGFIGLTIDLYNQRRHEQLTKEFGDTVSRETFKAAFKKHVPGPIVDHVFRHVFSHKFFRVKYISKYKLTKMQSTNKGRKEIAALDAIQEATVRNIGLVEDKYFFEMALDLTFIGGSAAGSVERFQIYEDKVDLQGKNLVPFLKELPDRTGYTLAYTIIIPAGQEKTLSVTFRQEHPLQGQEYICTMIPCGKLELYVSDPQEDFTVAATSLHPDVEVVAADKDDPICQAWKVDDLLPGHGISFSWRPKVKRKKVSRSKPRRQAKQPQRVDKPKDPV